VARRIFFSFHYERDIRRVAQIRNSWVVRAKGTAQPFYDKAEWESVKRNKIKKWIEEQLAGTSVTVVLIGAETYKCSWVLHEIERSYVLQKGILGVYIHNVKDPVHGTDTKGKNPLDDCIVEREGKKRPMSDFYKTYDWVRHDGYHNMAEWIETAANDAGR
jgi:hypothetical protein